MALFCTGLPYIKAHTDETMPSFMCHSYATCFSSMVSFLNAVQYKELPPLKNDIAGLAGSLPWFRFFSFSYIVLSIPHLSEV